MEKRDGIISVKEAVPGTTLVDKGTNSYINRMKTLDSQMELDLFVCQLSTNDATKKEKLGNISESTNMEDFDIITITGAIEYIIAYVEETWNCPVVFYTNPKYYSEAYNIMVTRLIELQDKWDVGVIDMWNDVEFNNISKEENLIGIPYEALLGIVENLEKIAEKPMKRARSKDAFNSFSGCGEGL